MIIDMQLSQKALLVRRLAAAGDGNNIVMVVNGDSNINNVNVIKLSSNESCSLHFSSKLGFKLYPSPIYDFMTQ